ncbi:MAG: cytochrome b/b6 domain-containing protein, partial [Desulfopila sp.]
MNKKALFLIVSLFLASAAQAADSRIWGGMLLANILEYGKAGSTGLGPLFTLLQNEYFVNVFTGVAVVVPLIFLLHYLVIGPWVFDHHGYQIYVFTLFQRLVHLLAVVSFIILVPTGLMMVFGKDLGGGALVMTARNLHAMATILFLCAVIPMFFTWVGEMLLTFTDLKWFLVLGGYLSRGKKEVAAGKFNAGQKVWFWVATLGGAV